MALNGISTLATKELRQKAKLDLAAAKRAADGNARATYDITQLPTQYDDNDVVDNPNSAVGGPGIKKVTYSGYHDEDVAFTDTATITDTTTATNFNIPSIAENTTVLYTGYLLGTYTGDWTFTQTGDDGAYLWIGANAVSGYTTGNANAVSTYNTTGTVTVAITAGVYYPIRLLYGNGPAGGFLNLTYAHTGQTATSDFTGKLFSPSVSLVQGRPWTDAPPTPTFSATPRSATINEGGNITVDIATTNFADGNVYFTVSGVSASDVQSGILPSGSTYVASGASAVSFNTAEDLTTEGIETLVFEVRTGSTSGPIVATANITINDTSLTPAPSYITDNLVLHLDAGNATSYSGSGSTTWTDLTGNSRNATLTSVTYTADNNGALVFDGTNSLGVINDTVINRYTNNFSVEVWYTSNNNTPRLLRTGQSSSGFNLGSYTTTPTKWKVTKYGVIDLWVGSIPQNTSWHQVVLVYSSTGGTKVYVDGALSETNANTAGVRATTWTYLEVGRSEAGSHNGKLGIVRYYNAVLSDANVLQNFNANKARYGL